MLKKEPIYISDKKEFKTGLIILTVFVSIFVIAFLIAAVFAPEGPYRPEGLEAWGGVIFTILVVASLWIMHNSQWKKLTLQEYVLIKKKDVGSSKNSPKIFLIFLLLSIISVTITNFLFMKSMTYILIIFVLLTNIFIFITLISGWFMIRYLIAKEKLKELQRKYPQEKIL